jgi:Fe-S cluster assembly protein SufD
MTVTTDTPIVAFPVPTGREEAWRFTPLARMRGLHVEVAGSPAPDVEVDPAPEMRWTVVPTSSLTFSDAALDRSSHLAREASAETGVLTLPRETVSSRPTVIRVTGDGVEKATVGNLLIEAEPFSSGTVVIEHTGSAAFSGNVEIRVGDSASLRVISVQDWSDDAVHVGRQHAVLGRDSRFRSFVATFGGDLVRLVPTVEYSAPGGDAELFGIFFADAGQHLEHRSLVDHTAPHCRSNVLYKGALKGDPSAGDAGIARTVWIGDVIIRALAVGTDTYELNRNLVLTPAGRADSVPNLEIETGEIIGAGHASATGRFDDEQLFYLQARGIPADVATRLVVRGFFADVIAKLGDPTWESHLQDRIDAELGFTPAIGGDTDDEVDE